jgi:hypothetical protein
MPLLGSAWEHLAKLLGLLFRSLFSWMPLLGSTWPRTYCAAY